MAKSLRSKREKRLRAIRREIVEPFYDKKEAAKLAAQEAALAAPKLEVPSKPNTAMEASTSTNNTNIGTSSLLLLHSLWLYSFSLLCLCEMCGLIWISWVILIICWFLWKNGICMCQNALNRVKLILYYLLLCSPSIS